MVFSGTSPDNNLVEFVELPGRRAPLLRRHPGPPRAALAPDPAAPAVRRAGRGRDPAPARAADPDRRERAAAPLGRRGRRHDGRARGGRAPTRRRAIRAARPCLRRPRGDSPTSPQLAGRRHARPPPRRLGGRAARGRRAAARAPGGDLPPARGRAPRRGRGARGRRRRSGSAASASTATPAAGVFVELPAGICDAGGRGPAGHRRARAARGGGAAGRALAAPGDARTPAPGSPTSCTTSTSPPGSRHADRGDFELHAEEAEIETGVGAGRGAARGGARRAGPGGPARVRRTRLRRAEAARTTVTPGTAERIDALLREHAVDRRPQRPALGGAREGRLRLRPARADRHRDVPRGRHPHRPAPAAGRGSRRPVLVGVRARDAGR